MQFQLDSGDAVGLYQESQNDTQKRAGGRIIALTGLTRQKGTAADQEARRWEFVRAALGKCLPVSDSVASSVFAAAHRPPPTAHSPGPGSLKRPPFSFMTRVNWLVALVPACAATSTKCQDPDHKSTQSKIPQDWGPERLTEADADADRVPPMQPVQPCR